uniref:CTCK domain-containing protein n=1 Tax=Mola mola TaxID=94237 RepID=A0A3Q3WEZ3_MOLML
MYSLVFLIHSCIADRLSSCSTAVTVYSCDGKCPSATIFNFNINSHARFCKCCRESGLQTRSITLYCSRNATVVDYNFQEPLDCSCQGQKGTTDPEQC